MAVVEDRTIVGVYHGASDETIRIAEIALAEIVTPGFQRERKAPHIAKIAGEYDATAYIFPIVAVFKDEFIGIDGQQRLAALEQKEATSAFVLLIEGIKSMERLAALFLKINRDRKLLSALEKYLGAVAAKDKGTLEIQRITGEFGLEVSHSASANGRLPAGAVESIYRSGRGELLQRVLMVREIAWGNTGAREANEGKTLAGLAKFLKRYWDNVDDDRLVTILRKQHPGYILQAIDKNRGVSQIMSYSDYVREQYNKGLRGKGKL